MKRSKHRRRPVNLTLTEDSVAQARRLQKILLRPSVSNVVTFLIEQEAAKLKAQEVAV